MPVGYSYKRFSTPEQRRGDSLRRQTEGPGEWCLRNGVTLDQSITLSDLGVSALHGLHSHKDNADKYALAAFLAMCEAGRIEKGSFLIVENLDRLTREHLRAATRLFLSILDYGVSIVTLTPEKVYRHDSNDMTDILIAIIELSRAHGESARKSEMVGKAWRQRKAKASPENPVTSMCPLWLRVEGKRFVQIADRVEVVRRIYRECVEGRGGTAIAQKLNKEKVPPFRGGRAQMWNARAVKRILANRAVLGEYRPHTGHRKRKETGEIVHNYYPQIISETDFYAARQAVDSRNLYGGKSSGKAVNLFTSLIFDGEDGTKWCVHGCGKMQDGRQAKAITNAEAVTKGTAKRKAIPYRIFEKGLLEVIRGVTPADLLPPGKSQEGDRLAQLSKEADATTAQITEAQELMVEGGSIKAGMELLRRLEARKAELVRECEAIKRSLATPVVDSLTQSHSLIELLDKAEDKDALRDKLRAKLANLIESITVWYKEDTPGNHYGARTLFAVVEYRTGATVSLQIYYRPYHVGRNRPEVCDIKWVWGTGPGGAVDHFNLGAPLSREC